MSDRLMSRLRGMVSRAVVSVVNDSLKMQGLQVTMMADQTTDDAEHFQHYGFTSVPLPGAEGVALALNGSTDHTVIINVDDRRYRLKGLPGGEVALYDDIGQKVHLTRSGIIINGAGLPINITNTPSVTIDTPQTTCTGNLTVKGLMTYEQGMNGTGAGSTSTINGSVIINGASGLNVTTGGIVNRGVNVSSTHTHGGVAPGAAQTSVPQ